MTGGNSNRFSPAFVATMMATKSTSNGRNRNTPISFTMSSQKKKIFLSCFFLVVVIFPDAALVRGQFQEAQEPQCKPQEPTKYDWEGFNYYELLGLTEDENGNSKKKKNGQATIFNAEGISAKEIRKAYRKQAQKYHPDKQASKKKSTNTTSKNGGDNAKSAGALSIEESNARFAKIAEAYEFLLDESKRKDYDLFLEYCHNTEIVQDDESHAGRLSTMFKKRFHGLFDDLVSNRDPFKVFKDVFFGGEDDDDEDTYFDPNDPFSHLRYENNPQRHPNHQEHHPNEEPYNPQEDPLRVFHDKRFMYDPITGENVIRVLQTEEYPPSESRESSESRRGSTRGGSNSTFSSSQSSFYYRIIAQDFRERYDPFTAKQVYVPITEPYLQEDGFRRVSASRDFQTAKSSSSATSVESILHPWEVLTPRSKPMVSPNKRYIAGLSPDCELLVMLNPDRHKTKEDDMFVRNTNFQPPQILWGSKRPYGKNGYAVDNCFALLKGPHLVVTVGQHHQNNRILWHSDSRSDEDDSRHGYYEYEDEFGFWHKRQRSYLAQLDNDGSLTVYSVWSVPHDEEHPQSSNRFHHKSQHNSSAEFASSVARAARDFWHGRIPTHHEYDHLYSTSRSLTYKRCIYSTHGSYLPHGIGCYRISRRLHQVALEATLAVRKLVFVINHFADAWLDLIYEEDDLFFFLKESIRKNTNFGSKAATFSARWVRNVLERLKQLNLKKQ